MSKISFIFCVMLFQFVNRNIYAQDVSLGLLNLNSSLEIGSDGFLELDICNTSSIDLPANKLKPLVSLPSALVGNIEVESLPSGWSVNLNGGTFISFKNDQELLGGDCSQIIIRYTAHSIGDLRTITGSMGFFGPQSKGNLVFNDNATTTVAVTSSTLNSSVFENNGFRFFPNPTTDFLNITSSTNEIDKVEVLNLVGQVIKELEFNSLSVLLDVRDLPSQVYIIRSYSNRKSGIAKIIKN